MSAGIWSVLGLERTEDAREIRRAYGRRLKAIDVDADPAAFISLREALEQALAYASDRQHGDVAPEDAATDTALFEGADGGSIEPLPTLAPIVGSRDEPEEEEEDAGRFARLESLLFPGEVAPPPDEQALGDALSAVLNHPSMANIDRSAQVEFWLADVLYDSIPRSDPVIPTVVDHFGWERDAGAWDQPYLLQELVRRRRAFKLLAKVVVPGHKYHKVWRDLTSDKQRLGWRSMAHGENVARFLELIRTHSPAVEESLNPHRVALWDERLNRSVQSRLKLAVIVFVVMFALGKIAAVIDPPPRSSSSSAPVVRSYTVPTVYLEALVREATAGQVGLATLQAQNPELHRRLVARWEQARDADDQSRKLDEDLLILIEDEVRRSLRGGSYDLQVTYWRWAADRLKWLREQDVEDCARTADGDSVTRTLPPKLLEHLREVFAQALKEPPPRDAPAQLAPGEKRSYPIPGPIFLAATEAAKLDRESMGTALARRGSAAHRCAARIGLIEAAIAAPEAEGKKLVRDMSMFL